MKILIVIPYFVPATSYGGPVKVAYDLAKGLVARGHEVTVATTDVFDDRNRMRSTAEVIDGIKIFRFRNLSNYLAKKCNGYTPLMFIPWLVSHGREFDCIYCHDFFTLQSITVSFFSKFYKVPFLIQPHGCLSTVRRKARFSLLKNFFTFMFGGVLTNAQHIIALTEEEKKSILSIDSELAAKVVVVPNGLDLQEFANVEMENLHEKYMLPADSKIIGFIGRLSFIKGIDISLEVLSHIKDKVKFAFLIIGPDEGYRDRLKLLARILNIDDRVIFTGILNGEEKYRGIKSCDIFLLTSRDEGLPMTVLEVAALGVPQVISKESNVPELAEYKAGYIHSSSDIAGFAKSIEKLLNNENERQLFSQNSLEMVRELFNIRHTISTIEGLMANKDQTQSHE